MSRDLKEIQSSILLKKNQTSSLDGLEVLTDGEIAGTLLLTSTSKVALWRLWVYIVAFAIWTHEQFFDAHKADIQDLIARNKIHTERWYRLRALDFQYGFEYPETEITGYDNEGVELAVINAAKIVSQCSVQSVGSRLNIKAAKDAGASGLEALSILELQSFTQYMNLIKDAGTNLTVTSRDPDDFKLTLDVYFDPLVLDGNGARRDGDNDTPVIDSMQDFLYNLEFNGEFLTDSFETHVKEVQGVELLGLNSISARSGTNPYAPIVESYLSDAGYMKLDINNIVLNYIPRNVQ